PPVPAEPDPLPAPRADPLSRSQRTFSPDHRQRSNPPILPENHKSPPSAWAQRCGNTTGGPTNTTPRLKSPGLKGRPGGGEPAECIWSTARLLRTSAHRPAKEPAAENR